MFGKFIFFISLITISHYSNAQKKKDDTKLITISNTGARDCIFKGNDTWLLAENGKLYILDSLYNIKKTFSFKSKIKAIAKDTSGNIITAEANGTLTKIKSNLDTQILSYTGQNPINIAITKQNAVLLITDKGIYLPEDERLYYEDAFTGSLRMIFQDHWRPSCLYLDPEDNLWMGFGAGEWGGNIIIFSTDKKRFTNLNEKLSKRCYLMPVKSFFSIDTTLYTSVSVMHFNIRSSIYQITDTCKEIFESAGYSDTVINEVNDDGIYIGPTLYNPSDGCIYFYCQLGVYKSKFNAQIKDFKNWQLVFKPTLKWQSGQPDAIGSPMNVEKMLLHNSKLYLISSSNGLLVWDWKSKILIK